MNAKINKAEDAEIIEVYLNEKNCPIAYRLKLEELMENGMDEDDARTYLHNSPITLELIYQKELGLFAVESDAIECTTIYSPYDGSECEESEED